MRDDDFFQDHSLTCLCHLRRCGSLYQLGGGEEGAKVGESQLQPPPMDLQKLLGILPVSPEGWRIKRSQARTLYRENLQAYGMREYEKIPSDEAKERPPAEKVVVVIRDTCGMGPYLAPFRNKGASQVGGDFEKSEWNGYPAMLVKLGKTRSAFRILVGERFVVEVIFSGEDLDVTERWLAACKLGALEQIEKRVFDHDRGAGLDRDARRTQSETIAPLSAVPRVRKGGGWQGQVPQGGRGRDRRERICSSLISRSIGRSLRLDLRDHGRHGRHGREEISRSESHTGWCIPVLRVFGVFRGPFRNHCRAVPRFRF